MLECVGIFKQTFSSPFRYSQVLQDDTFLLVLVVLSFSGTSIAQGLEPHSDSHDDHNRHLFLAKYNLHKKEAESPAHSPRIAPFLPETPRLSLPHGLYTRFLGGRRGGQETTVCPFGLSAAPQTHTLREHGPASINPVSSRNLQGGLGRTTNHLGRRLLSTCLGILQHPGSSLFPQGLLQKAGLPPGGTGLLSLSWFCSPFRARARPSLSAFLRLSLPLLSAAPSLSVSPASAFGLLDSMIPFLLAGISVVGFY